MSQLNWFGAAALAYVAATGCDPAPENTTGGTGGIPGTMGAGGAPVVCPVEADDLISDFKTDNSIAASSDGRQGGWYVYGDDSGMFDPPVVANTAYPIDMAQGNPSCSGAGALHLKATGFSQWGAALGTDFKPRLPPEGAATTGIKQTYDASKYRGVAFWAKASAPVKGLSVKFPDFYQDREAHVVGSPDRCVLTSGSESNCSPYLVIFGSSAFPSYMGYQVDTTWKRFVVLFADAKQDTGNPGWTKPPGDKLNKDKLVGLAIQVNADYSSGSPKANDFEIWIDDVEFIK